MNLLPDGEMNTIWPFQFLKWHQGWMRKLWLVGSQIADLFQRNLFNLFYPQSTTIVYVRFYLLFITCETLLEESSWLVVSTSALLSHTVHQFIQFPVALFKQKSEKGSYWNQKCLIHSGHIHVFVSLPAK